MPPASRRERVERASSLALERLAGVPVWLPALAVGVVVVLALVAGGASGPRRRDRGTAGVGGRATAGLRTVF